MKIKKITPKEGGLLLKVEADSSDEIENLRKKIEQIKDVESAECTYLNK